MNGYLALIGGAEDKKDDKKILKHVLSLSKKKKVVIIPTANRRDPLVSAKNYENIFFELGAESSETLDIREREECFNNNNLDIIDGSNLIFFTGGDQERLSEIFLDTPLFRKIQKLYKSGTTIAGTSAGAAIMGCITIFDGDYRGFYKGSIDYCDGFGFLNEYIIDTHFLKRNRLPRLIQGLISCEHTQQKGIGIDEDTALILKDGKGYVIGSGCVVMVNTERCKNNFEETKEGERFSLTLSEVGFLFDGEEFNPEKWISLFY